MGCQARVKRGFNSMMNANARSGHDRSVSLPNDIQFGLDEFFTTAKNRLLCGSTIEIEFPPGVTSQCWPTEEIEKLNSDVFDDLVNTGNLYAIFAGGGNGAWTPKYVGTSARKVLSKRMKEHLVVSTGPASKIGEVKCEVSNGRKIAISYVRIEPEDLREYLEKRIISEEKGRVPGQLSWNIRH